MIKIRASVKASDALIKGLQQISGNATKKALGQAAKAGAEHILQAAKKKAPVDTGKLKSSLGSKFAYRSQKAVRVSIVTDMKIPPKSKSRHTYDFYQEFGTSQHRAQPFMRPAFDTQKYNAVESTRKAMEKAVIEEVKKLARLSN